MIREKLFIINRIMYYENIEKCMKQIILNNFKRKTRRQLKEGYDSRI